MLKHNFVVRPGQVFFTKQRAEQYLDLLIEECVGERSNFEVKRVVLLGGNWGYQVNEKEGDKDGCLL